MTPLVEEMARLFGALANWEQWHHDSLRGKLAVEDVDSLCGELDAYYDQLSSIAQEILSDNWLAAAVSLDVDALLSRVQSIVEPSKNIDPSKFSVMDLANALAGAQLIDAWFAIVVDFSAVAHNADQEELRKILDLNSEIVVGNGIVVSKFMHPWMTGLDTKIPVGLFARFLDNITYLPGWLRRDDPDELGVVSENLIGARLVRLSSSGLISRPVPSNPSIAVAPLAERGSDVSFLPHADGQRYAMELNYDDRRLVAALDVAMTKGVHILLVPEMTLAEGDRKTFDKRIRDLITDARIRYFERSGRVSEFRILLAGVLGVEGDDGFHRNFCAIFDYNGVRLQECDQLKLSHWNLKRFEQVMFGISHYKSSQILSDPIKENSKVADSINLVEIPGIGRVATFICADMSQNAPGDWLFMNGMIDWIYAPIMDKSICWVNSDLLGHKRPWIVRRTYRTARMAGTLVTATNSMALTRWVNEANTRNKVAIKFDKIGIGLAIDGRIDPPTHDHRLVDVDSRAVFEIFEPDALAWKPFLLK